MYRTHGFGYLYRRYGSQTWVKDLDYFSKHPTTSGAASELEYAGVAWPDGVKPGSPPPMPAWDGGLRAPPPIAEISGRSRLAAPRAAHRRRSPSSALRCTPDRADLAGLSGACRVVDAGKDDWRSALESERPPPIADRVVAASCASWPTASPGHGRGARPSVRARRMVRKPQSPDGAIGDLAAAQIVTPISLMEKIRHLFVADAAAEAHLAGELEGRRPMQLPLAAQVIPESVPVFGERRSQVAFVGTWAVSGAGGPAVNGSRRSSRSRPATDWSSSDPRGRGPRSS